MTLQLNAFGGDGMNGFRQKPLNKTASSFDLVAIMAEEEMQTRGRLEFFLRSGAS